MKKLYNGVCEYKIRVNDKVYFCMASEFFEKNPELVKRAGKKKMQELQCSDLDKIIYRMTEGIFYIGCKQ